MVFFQRYTSAIVYEKVYECEQCCRLCKQVRTQKKCNLVVNSQVRYVKITY